MYLGYLAPVEVDQKIPPTGRYRRGLSTPGEATYFHYGHRPRTGTGAYQRDGQVGAGGRLGSHHHIDDGHHQTNGGHGPEEAPQAARLANDPAEDAPEERKRGEPSRQPGRALADDMPGEKEGQVVQHTLF